MTAPTTPEPGWRARGCTIAGREPGEWCGQPLHGAVLIRTYPLPIHLDADEPPREGAALVCRHHFAALTDTPRQDGTQ